MNHKTVETLSTENDYLTENDFTEIKINISVNDYPKDINLQKIDY